MSTVNYTGPYPDTDKALAIVNVPEHLRPRVAKLLRAVKKRLWDGVGVFTVDRSSMVCFTIGSTANLTQAEAARVAIDLVTLSIAPRATVTGWLVEQGVPEVLRADSAILQHVRHHMVDDLIAGLETVKEADHA